MTKSNVVQLGMVRDLLAEWEKVRRCIALGRVGGFYTVIRNDNNEETIYLGGAYKEDPNAALKCMLKVSAARAVTEDQAPVSKP